MYGIIDIHISIYPITMKRLVYILIIGTILLVTMTIFMQRMLNTIEAPTVEKNEVDYPIAFMKIDNIKYNPMVPYLNEIDPYYLDETISVINDEINIYINKLITENIEYEIYNPLKLNVLQYGYAKKTNDNNDGMEIKIPIDFESTEQRLILKLTTKYNSKQISYYQNLKLGDNNIDVIFDNISKIHKYMLEQNKKVINWIPEIETNEGGTFYLANINSSKEVLLWENFEVIEMNNPYPILRKYNNETGDFIIDMDFVIANRINQTFEYWDFKESYSGTFLSERIILNEFTRTGNLKNEPFFEKKLQQWILDKGSFLPAIEKISDNKEFLAISYKDEIWLVDIKYNEVYKIFGHDILDNDYIYDEWKQYKIKLLDVDNEGKITYLIYGYLNDGPYMGYNGILVNEYNHLHKVNEIKSFITISYPAKYLEKAIDDKSIYIDKLGKLFMIIDQKLYEVMLEDGTVNNIVNLPDNIQRYKDVIFYSSNNKENYQINILNLGELEVKNKILPFENNIKIINYFNEGLILGEYNLEDTYEYLNGEVFYPYYKIYIIDYFGNNIKTINSQNGNLFGDITIDNKQIKANVYKLNLLGNKENNKNIKYNKIEEQQIYLFENTYEDELLDLQMVEYKNGMTVINNFGIPLREEVIVADNNYLKLPKIQSIRNNYKIYELYKNEKEVMTFISPNYVFQNLDENMNYRILTKDFDGKRTLLIDGNTEKNNSLLNVPLLKQFPELIRGCEITSLAMLLNYHLDYYVDKTQLSKEIKYDTTEMKVENGIINFGNLHKGFVGSMDDPSKPGLGVYIEPIIELAEKYVGDTVYNISNIPMDHLLKIIDNGYPVQVIIPIHYNKVTDNMIINWKTPSGYMEITYREHSVIIVGYDDKYIYFNDPNNGKLMKQDIKNFQAGWESMGSQGMVIIK